MPARLLHRCAAALLLAAAALPAQAAKVYVQGDALVFDGRIEEDAAAAFLAFVPDPRVTRVVITSRGGLVAPALDMGEAIHARGLDVDVPKLCLFSCANYIFPAGRRKRLGHPDAVGWHGNMAHVLYLDQTGQGSWSESEMASARALALREAEFFRMIGVDGFVCWFAKLPPYDVEDFYSLSPADMAHFGIHDVTIEDPTPVNAGLGVREVRLAQ